ncbi:T9SS type A sorting domain-containing protein [Portibacter lacus]|uniref:HYR domain-containing protein n=1 Tax=Portibacter lacus TaxID=1099794 RepID=A0AA37SVN3_9BACT|nr:T9SS type A sorting domain-containing protein [Portibacter lacus]GLR19671.1 hypothetical protein GCM10007940_42870 [Portibacter lacus]
MNTQFYPIARKLRNFVAFILTLFIVVQTSAQDHLISGDASNYNSGNSYPGATVNGNLTICCNAFNLQALGDNVWANLQTITGDLIITGTVSLGNLNGLQHLTSVGGSVIIQGNSNLNSISSLANLQSIGGDLTIDDNNSLGSLAGLENVVTIGGSLYVKNNASISSFTTNTNWTLESVQNVGITNNANLTQIFSFNNITNLNNLSLSNNSKITWFAPFPALQSAASFVISSNTQLTGIGSFANLSSLSSLEVSGNTSLQTCCSLLPLMALSGAATYVNTNAAGCESVAAVNAPPSFDICPPNTTVNTDPNSCVNSFSFRLPIGSDNCDFDKATVKITRGDGSIWFDDEYGSPGNTFDYPLITGTNTFAFKATDHNGNSATCNTIITVVDNQPPKAISGYNFNLDNSAGSNCMGTFTPPAAGFTDNCGILGFILYIQGSLGTYIDLSFSATEVPTIDLEIDDYTYEILIFDDVALQFSYTGAFSITDDTQPEWENNITSRVIEIECGEATIAETLQANYPTALDDCSEVTLTIDDQDFLVSPCGLDLTEYEFIARDASNVNMTAFRLHINEVDTKKPVLSGVPNNITIGCNDPIPAFPTLTAMDACSGNLTSQISFTEIPSMGTCGNGQIAQILSRSASVSDDCINTATAQWTVTILSDFSFTLGDDQSICSGTNQNITLDPEVLGASYLWSTGATSKTISVSQSGTYALTVTTDSGCCYSDEVKVNIGTIPNISASGGTLNCTSGTVQLSGSSTTAGATFKWTGPGNFNSSSPNPTVANAGNYTLLVTSPQGCESTQVVSVNSDTDVPNATASGGSLSCSTTSLQLKGSSSTPGVSYSWTGPNNFQSSNQNPTVSSIGTYTLTVTGPNGCKAISTTEVIGNTDVPAISLIADQINCNNQSVSILIESDAILVSTEWTGPNSFSSSEKEPTVDLPGTYIVTVTSNNGCEVDFSIDIAEDLTTPDISADGGTISCDANFVSLTSSSTDNNATFLWSGPDNFTSSAMNPDVSQPGTYLLTVTGINGCSTVDSVMVMADTDLPNVSAQGGTIDCNNEEVTLTGASTTADITSSWTGPNGFMSAKDTNVVSTPGLYTYTIVSPGGCTSFKTVEVILDKSDPDLVILEGNVDCESQTRQFNISTNILTATYEWEGPDGFTSDLPFPQYSLSGTYFLTITGTNGCSTSLSFEVDEDIASDWEVITDGSSASINIISGTGPFTFIWGSEFGLQEITDLEEGQHNVTVIDGFGCSRKVQFTISTSSIDEYGNASNINIFPNPSQDVLHINLGNLDLPLKYTIYSIHGSEISSGEIKNQSNSIPVERYKSGIYLLAFKMDQKTKVLKFIKE